jgi:hypothetical protein
VAGFDDLRIEAQPALLAIENAEVTEGRSWYFAFTDVRDAAGAVIDLSGTTGVCEVWDTVGGSVVTTLAYTGTAGGTFDVAKAAATTGGFVLGPTPRRCRWGLRVTSGGTQVQFWGPSDSYLTILPAEA